jgi:hypothetical protein
LFTIAIIVFNIKNHSNRFKADQLSWY